MAFRSPLVSSWHLFHTKLMNIQGQMQFDKCKNHLKMKNTSGSKEKLHYFWHKVFGSCSSQSITWIAICQRIIWHLARLSAGVGPLSLPMIRSFFKIIGLRACRITSLSQLRNNLYLLFSKFTEYEAHKNFIEILWQSKWFLF